jgi:ATP-dependent Clp protease ATP-binding subunit ClpB
MMETLRAQFRPEFLNRVDEIIIFHSLSREQIGQIVDIQLRILSARLADRHMTINLTGAAKDLIVNEGFDPTYGARPLKRTIQRFLENPLSKKILQGEFQQGDSIRVEMEEDRLTFNKE